ncbi:putative eukaryotic translation initiation factor 2 subunit [Sesbania bispinosa]|nr:putative eukaryotic translation initiation factor 2 subunit [Sesbania bispinosa]
MASDTTRVTSPVLVGKPSAGKFGRGRASLPDVGAKLHTTIKRFEEDLSHRKAIHILEIFHFMIQKQKQEGMVDDKAIREGEKKKTSLMLGMQKRSAGISFLNLEELFSRSGEQHMNQLFLFSSQKECKEVVSEYGELIGDLLVSGIAPFDPTKKRRQNILIVDPGDDYLVDKLAKKTENLSGIGFGRSFHFILLLQGQHYAKDSIEDLGLC